MAKIPTPRSYQQLLGDMLDSFMAKQGITAVSVGGPILSTFESAAQSDFRVSQSIFTLLAAKDLDNASGVALDRIGRDERVPRIVESLATAKVVISDSSITKRATALSSSAPAPIIGATRLVVQDATGFPSSGSIYIGKGTSNFEGPIAYTQIIPSAPPPANATYYTLVLAAGTKRFHNVGEAVLLAQGGDRLVNAGTIVKTNRSGTQDEVRYATLYAATIYDGEVAVSDVEVVAVNPGTSGNCAAGDICVFDSEPFTGATVTNPMAVSNGTDTESDGVYRERIRAARAARAKATPLAIINATVGAKPSDESVKALSASLVNEPDGRGTLYVDDGSGYEPKSEPVSYEVLTDSASGGEQWFQLQYAPIPKAPITSAAAAPYAFDTTVAEATSRGHVAKLAVKVGGVYSEHLFKVEDFGAIDNASAYEIAASINSNPDILFGAGTVDSGRRVRLYARADTNESVEVVDASDLDNDANDVLLFVGGIFDSVNLYKNDMLLTKDGVTASIASNPPATWGAFTSPATIKVAVDGTPAVEYSITNADFVKANTGFYAIGPSVTMAAWAKVFNAVIPGINATVEAGRLVLSSNRGRDDMASLAITDGSLVSSGMFSVAEAHGKTGQYQLNRYNGQIKLGTPLAEGDRLTVGTKVTNAFVESSPLSSVTLASQADLWLVVDADATQVQHSLSGASTLTFTHGLDPTTGNRVVTATADSNAFGNVVAKDWVVLWDAAIAASDPTYASDWRVISAAASSFAIERGPYSFEPSAAAITLGQVGVTFIRSAVKPVKLSIAAGTYSVWDLADAINAQSQLVSADVVNGHLRIYTNTAGLAGKVSLVAQNASAVDLGFVLTHEPVEITRGSAVVESGVTDVSIPAFAISTASDTYTPPFSNVGFIDSTSTGTFPDYDRLVYIPQQYPLDAGTPRFGSNAGQYRSISSITSGASYIVEVAPGFPSEFCAYDNLHVMARLGIGPQDDLNVLVDGNTISKNYGIQLYRRLVPTEASFSGAPVFKDADNLDVDGNPEHLSTAFGGSFDFTDFAVYMRARCKSHSGPDTDKTVLWRLKDFEASGSKTSIRYEYPSAPNTELTVSQGHATDAADKQLKVVLPSGAPVSFGNLRPSMKIGVLVQKLGVTGDTYCKLNYIFGLDVVSAIRTSNKTTLEFDPSVVGASKHNIAVGSIVYLNSSNEALFPSGAYTVTDADDTTISYTDIGDDDVAAGIGFVGVDSALSTASHYELPADLAANAKVLSVGLNTGLGAVPGTTSHFKHYGKLHSATNLVIEAHVNYISAVANPADFQPIAWYELKDVTGLVAFPLDTANCTIEAIAASVNALDHCPVEALAVGTGADSSGSVVDATVEETGNPTTWYSFTEGRFFVQYNTIDGNGDYKLTFKPVSIASNLLDNSDWANEQVRIVPSTIKNLVDFLNVPSVTGLSSAASIRASGSPSRLQLESLTVGSGGSIQVTGGSANAARATVLGTTLNGATMSVLVDEAEVKGFATGSLVRIQNQRKAAKAAFGATTNVKSVSVNASADRFTLTADVSDPGTYQIMGAVEVAIDNTEFNIVKHGDFACYTPTGLGDGFATELNTLHMVNIAAPSGNYANGISAANKGWFRAVRSESGKWSFWVYNPDAVEETVYLSLSALYCAKAGTYTLGPAPGDTLVITLDPFNLGLVGSWLVVDVHLDPVSGYVDSIVLDKAGRTVTANAAINATLGDAAPFFRLLDGSTAGTFKRVVNVSPSSETGLYELVLEDDFSKWEISETYGSVVTAVDKLAFPVSAVVGVDGYRYSTGLIKEVNRIVYGDARDSATYPGVAAQGARIDIDGPVVRRVKISLAIRSDGGSEIVDLVKSAVAAVINQTGIGQPIALSDIVSAANSVGGVTGVAIIEPSYSATSDRIVVQPSEKPMVLDLENDITISFIGE